MDLANHPPEYPPESVGVSDPRSDAWILSVTQVRDEFLRRTGERRGRHGSSPVAGTEAEKRRKGEKEKSTVASQSNHFMTPNRQYTSRELVKVAQ